jgi:hypothetical protein
MISRRVTHRIEARIRPVRAWCCEAFCPFLQQNRRLGRPEMFAFICFGWTLLFSARLQAAPGQAPAQALQLTLTTETATVTEPLPALLILHFHNSGTQPLWIYRPVRDAGTISQSPLGASPGGSTIMVDVSPAGANTGGGASSSLLQSASLPQPRLVNLPPGGDAAEHISVHIVPASQKTAGSPVPVWGPYRLSVHYSASYSNADSVNQELGVQVWQGSLTTSPVELQLQSAPPENRGWITGTLLSRQQQQAWGVLVTLSNWSEQALSQQVTGVDGGFTFGHLPFGRYWITVRRLGADRETGFFEHAEISDAHPGANLKLILLGENDYRARELLHKPVLLRVTDSGGKPLSDTELAILWTSGTVMQNFKLRTGADGLLETDLIPGTNYITLRRRGCRKKDQAVEVPPGSGIAGFAMTMTCKD